MEREKRIQKLDSEIDCLNLQIMQLEEQNMMLTCSDSQLVQYLTVRSELFHQKLELIERIDELKIKVESAVKDSTGLQTQLRDNDIIIRQQKEEIAKLKTKLTQMDVPDDDSPLEAARRRIEQLGDKLDAVNELLSQTDAELQIQRHNLRKNRLAVPVDTYKYYEAFIFPDIMINLLCRLVPNSSSVKFAAHDCNIMQYKHRLQLMQEVIALATKVDGSVIQMLVDDQYELVCSLFHSSMTGELSSELNEDQMIRTAVMVMKELQ